MKISDIPQVAERVYGCCDANTKFQLETNVIDLVGMYINLPQVLQVMPMNKYSMLLVPSVLLQTIRKGSYLPSLNTLMEELTTCNDSTRILKLNKEIDALKHRTYWMLITACYQILTSRQLQSYMVNTFEQLAGVCLKHLFHTSQDINYLKTFVQMAFQGMHSQPQFQDETRKLPALVSPSNHALPIGLLPGLNILISLLDDQMQFSNYKSYYDMRKTANLFKTNYLALVLEVAVYHIKLILLKINENVAVFAQLKKDLQQCLKLLDMCVNYPFNLTMNVFDSDLETKDQHSGEIYFPGYFRNITCDKDLLMKLCILHNAIIKKKLQSDNSNIIVNTIIDILCRLAGSHTYYFHSEIERKEFRGVCIDIACAFMEEYSFYDNYYTNSLISFVARMLTNFSGSDVGERFKLLSSRLLVFCMHIITHCPLKLDNIETNVISRCFDLLKMLEGSISIASFINLIEDDPQLSEDSKSAFFKQQFQMILTRYMHRFNDVPNIVRLFREKEFRTYRKQITCFKEIFAPVCIIFDIQYTNNINQLTTIDFKALPIEGQQVLIHLCTRMLFQTKRGNITVPYAAVKRLYNHIASQAILTISHMAFLIEFLSNILQEVFDGESTSGLWIRMKMQDDFYSFPEVIKYCITRCINNFSCNDTHLIDCSLDTLKMIYCNIKKHSDNSLDPNSAAYNQLFISFLDKLESSVFAQPAYFKKRIVLFEMISIIWLENGVPRDVYNFYNRVKKTFDTMTHFDNFYKYIYDISGLIGALNSNNMYTVLLDLVVQDLPYILNIYFKQISQIANMDHDTARRAIVRLFEALLKDNSQRVSRKITTVLPIQVDLMWPILEECGQHSYSKRLLIVWKSLTEMNKVRQLPLLPLISNLEKQSHKEHYDRLVRCYLDNMLRVTDLLQLYPLIKQHIDNMYEWWETIIDKGIDPSIDDFNDLINAKLWKSQRQQQITAKILFMAGNFRPRFRIYPQLFDSCPTEKQFVKRFIEKTSLKQQ